VGWMPEKMTFPELTAPAEAFPIVVDAARWSMLAERVLNAMEHTASFDIALRPSLDAHEAACHTAPRMSR
jgi:hypothetical protein